MMIDEGIPPMTSPLLSPIRHSIRDGDLISIVQFLRDTSQNNPALLSTQNLLQLGVSAVYAYRLKILSYLLAEFPQIMRRKTPLSYGDLANVALAYDQRALCRIMQAKYAYLEDAGECDWGILHKWVVARWLVTYEKDLKEHAESPVDSDAQNNAAAAAVSDEMPSAADMSAIEASTPSSSVPIGERTITSILSQHEVPQPTEEEFSSQTLLNAQDQHGWTPLHLAAMLGDLNACETLVARGANLLIQDYEALRQPLHMAAACGHPKIVEYLMFSGADVEALTKRKENILLVAIKHGQVEVVRFLLNEFVSNLETDHDANGNFPMLLAIKHSQPAIVKLLIEAGVDPNREINDDMITYLHFLCSLQYCKKSEQLIAKLLISYGGANVDAKDKHGATPLHYALLYNREEMAELLLKHNAVFTEATIDLIRTNVAAQKLYFRLRKKKLTEHAAALVYPLDTMRSYVTGLSGHTSAYTNYGEMYVFGGNIEKKSNKSKNLPVKYSNKLLVFRSSFAEGDHGQWEEVPTPREVAKRAFHSCVFLNGKLWFYGGENESGRLALFQCYDTLKQEWMDFTPPGSLQNGDQRSEYTEESLDEQLQGYPGPLSKHTATISFRKHYTIEEIFDQDVATIRKRFHEFRESRDPLMIQGCPDAPNAVPDSQRMVIYGGITADGEITDQVWEYQFSTGQWTKRPQGPPARRGHTSVYDHHRNSLLIFGGFDGANFLNDMYDYSLWDYEVNMIGSDVQGENVPPPRTGHAAILSSNRMWVFGGFNGTRLNDLWYLSLESGKWNQVDISTSRFLPRFNFSVNFINEKQIVVFGGKRIVNNNLILVHLPEHHKLHEKIFASHPVEDHGEEYSDEYAGETDEDQHLISGDDADQYEEDEVVRDIPTTEYY